MPASCVGRPGSGHWSGRARAARDHASASRVSVLLVSRRSAVPTWASPRPAACRRLLGPCLLRPKPAFARVWSVEPLAGCARGRGACRGGGSNPTDSCAGVLTAVSFPPGESLSAPWLHGAVRGGGHAWAPDALQFLPNVGCSSVCLVRKMMRVKRREQRWESPKGKPRNVPFGAATVTLISDAITHFPKQTI